MKYSDSDYLRDIRYYAINKELEQYSSDGGRLNQIADTHDCLLKHLNGPSLDEAYDNARAYLAALEDTEKVEVSR